MGESRNCRAPEPSQIRLLTHAPIPSQQIAGLVGLASGWRMELLPCSDWTHHVLVITGTAWPTGAGMVVALVPHRTVRGSVADLRRLVCAVQGFAKQCCERRLGARSHPQMLRAQSIRGALAWQARLLRPWASAALQQAGQDRTCHLLVVAVWRPPPSAQAKDPGGAGERDRRLSSHTATSEPVGVLEDVPATDVARVAWVSGCYRAPTGRLLRDWLAAGCCRAEWSMLVCACVCVRACVAFVGAGLGRP